MKWSVISNFSQFSSYQSDYFFVTDTIVEVHFDTCNNPHNPNNECVMKEYFDFDLGLFEIRY